MTTSDTTTAPATTALQPPALQTPSMVIRDRSVWMETFKNFAISATASGIGATAVYPVDLVKTRMQNQRKALAGGAPSQVLYKTSIDCFQKTLRNEGFLGLYKGLLPNLVGQVPEKAIRLWVVSTVRDLAFDKTVEDLDKVQLKAEIMAGTAAGACQVLITNPAEIVKVRLQVAGEVKQSAAGGAPKPLGFVGILRQLGFGGIYKGASACFLRDVPFSGLYFPIYAKMKEFLKSRGNGDLSALDLFVSGSIAGVFAASLTTPADVIKTRLQVEPRPGEVPYAGLRDCFWRVLRTEGVKALFKGVGPRVFRSSPQYGVMLLSYELLQKLFNADREHDLVEPLELGNSIVVEDRWTVMNRWDVPPAFTRAPEGRKMEKIAIGGLGNVWGMRKNHEVLKWTGFEWKTVPGVTLDYISVGADGAAWGVDQKHRVLRWDPWYSRFVEVPTPAPMRKVSVGNSGKIWGVSTNNDVYKFSPKGWKKRGNLAMKHVSVGADGSVWAIENGTNSVWRWLSDTNEWNPVKFPPISTSEERMKHISVGGRNVVWGVSTSNQLYHWQEQEGQWSCVSNEKDEQLLSLKTVSVAADGTVVGFGIPKLKGKLHY